MLELKPEWKQLLPFTDDATFTKELSQHANLIKATSGQTICQQGDHCAQLAILISGVIRVFKVGENGREITLYRILPGDSCVLSASCIISQQPFPAIARVEEEAVAISIPTSKVRQWMATHEAWREYVFGLFSTKLSEVITRIDDIAFRRMDQRVAQYLLQSNQPLRDLQLTHQQIADDLGSAREVISRILKDFEHNHWVTLTRGRIAVDDSAKLEGLYKK